MKWLQSASIAVLPWLALTVSLSAQTGDPGLELAFMSATTSVTLLNEGREIRSCGSETYPRRWPTWIRTRRLPAWDRERPLDAAAQLSPGGCPFMTTFDLPDTEYAKACG